MRYIIRSHYLLFIIIYNIISTYRCCVVSISSESKLALPNSVCSYSDDSIHDFVHYELLYNGKFYLVRVPRSSDILVFQSSLFIPAMIYFGIIFNIRFWIYLSKVLVAFYSFNLLCAIVDEQLYPFCHDDSLFLSFETRQKVTALLKTRRFGKNFCKEIGEISQSRM